MEDNQTVDTSQEANPNTDNTAFDAPQTSESSITNNLTVEDAFFSGQEEQSQATPPSQEQAPMVKETPTTETEYQAKNDEKRFEYWQSQAAQRENELTQLKTQMEQQPVVLHLVVTKAHLPE